MWRYNNRQENEADSGKKWNEKKRKSFALRLAKIFDNNNRAAWSIKFRLRGNQWKIIRNEKFKLMG